MPATSRERVRSIDPFIWIVAGLTLLARTLAWAAGLHVDLSPIGPTANQHAWQLLDLNLLRHDLLSASGSLIMQPPLYNLAVGTLLHLPAHLQASAAGIGLLACSLVISLATYSTMTLLGIARGLALAVTVVLVVADPASLLFSSSLFYAAPAAALATATAWAAVRLFERPSGSRAGLFGAIAATLALTNTSYQPVMVLVVFVVVAAVLRASLRQIVVGLALPALLLVAWSSAMWVETGAPTTSTWLGMNLAHVTTGAAPRPLVRQLVADGTLSRTALVPAFSSLRAYRIRPVTSGPAAQAQVTRSDGQPNLNNPGYETASAHSLHDDLAFIVTEPAHYLHTVGMGLRIWAIPGDQYYLFTNHQELKGYVAAYDHLIDLQVVRDPYLPLVILDHQPTPLDQMAWTEVVLSALAIIGAPIVALVERRRRPRLSWALLLTWALLAQAFLVSSLTEYGENNRFRFETGTLRITLSVVVVATLVDRLRGGSSSRATRLDSLGWASVDEVPAAHGN